jgi:FkbM family methyltransferase
VHFERAAELPVGRIGSDVGVASKVFAATPTRVLIPAIALQYRFLEPELRKLDDLVPPGRGAVDAGVWWGPWSWWLARRVPRVDSFEPNPDLVDALTPVLPSNVFLHPVALSDKAGDSSLWIPPGMGTQGRASLDSSTPMGENWRSEEVVTSRLDDFDLGDVGFVKIDVGGHELAVLRGAADLLASQRPNILVAIEDRSHRDGQFDEIVKLLTDLSYRGSYLHKGQWHPIEDIDRQAVHEMANHVAEHGHAAGLLIYARKYIHNFYFRPI